ncbi:hypothetical protein IG631_11502 [Alternaria alternata]|nr:hypothetical protein IG631_11502 [Alternaria alternata]
MGRTAPVHLSLPEAVATTSLPKSCALSPLRIDATKPFRFLDLPKEIRQMIYGELHPATRRHKVHLQEGQDHMTLACITVPGVSILATNRQIYEEAGYILNPLLKKILATPPTVIIRANHLLGLIDLNNSFAISRVFWSWLTCLLKHRLSSCVKDIRRYRDGRLSNAKLLKQLCTNSFTRKHIDARMLEALISFLLRTIKYAGTKPKPMYKYPPITVVVEIPDGLIGLPVVTTTSRAKRFAFKVMCPNSPTPRRVFSGYGDLPWLLHRLAYHACIAGHNRHDISFNVRLRFLGADEAEIEQPSWNLFSEDQLHVQIIKGVKAARSTGKGLLYYGGLVQNMIEEEV